MKSPLGLWLDPAALTNGDSIRVLAVLQQGIASAEYAAFVARLDAGAPEVPDAPAGGTLVIASPRPGRDRAMRAGRTGGGPGVRASDRPWSRGPTPRES